MLRCYKLFVFIVIIHALPILFCCCAVNRIKTGLYYSIPTLSYLRECPDYNCPVVSEIYNGDEVKILGKNDTGWLQVQSMRDQKTGWTRQDLVSDIPIIPKNYFVTVNELPLRDSPSEDIVSRKELGYGDQVQKLAEKDGWWRVLAEKDKAIGWVPAKLVSETRPEQIKVPPKSGEAASEPQPSSQKPYYFVAAENVNLYLIPSASSRVVKVLKLNDAVAKISQSGTDWLKVRYLDTGAEGWAYARFFKDSPVTKKEQILTKKKKVLKKAASPNRKENKETESESLEPEGM